MQQEFEVKHGIRQEHFRRQYEVNVDNRFEFMSTSTATEREPFIYSFCHVQKALVLRHHHQTHIDMLHTPSSEYGLPNVLVWEMAFGNGSPYPTQTGLFEICVNDEPAARVALSKTSKVWSLNGFKLAFVVNKLKVADFGHALFLDADIREESIASVGLAALQMPLDKVQSGQPTRITIRSIGNSQSVNWIRVGKTPDGLAFVNAEPAVRLAVEGMNRLQSDGYNLYFGDIHAHSGESAFLGWGCGEKSRRENLTFARDTALLDFAALTEHDWQMNTDDWDSLQELNDEFYVPEEFTTIHSYEWTSCNYGHRNIYFKRRGAPLFYSSIEQVAYGTWNVDNPTPADLWMYLDSINIEAITAPHHPSVVLFPIDPHANYNEKYDRLLEIYSSWGSSESGSCPTSDDISLVADRFSNHGAIDFLESGFQYGFSGSSDAHDGHPGQAQGTDRRPQLYHYLGSGRTVALANRLDRDSIFDALKARRVYATTGEPIVLGFSYGESLMGASTPFLGAPFRVHVRGTQPISQIDIVKNGHRVFTVCPRTYEFTDDWCDPTPRRRPIDYYYLTVRQEDKERAWSSPIWVVNT